MCCVFACQSRPLPCFESSLCCWVKYNVHNILRSFFLLDLSRSLCCLVNLRASYKSSLLPAFFSFVFFPHRSFAHKKNKTIISSWRRRRGGLQTTCDFGVFLVWLVGDFWVFLWFFIGKKISIIIFFLFDLFALWGSCPNNFVFKDEPFIF